MADIPATVVNGSKELALRAAAQDDTINPSRRSCLVVQNGGAGPVDVSVPAYYDNDPASDDVIASVPAGETWLIPVSDFSSGPDGLVDLTYSDITTVNVGQVEFP